MSSTTASDSIGEHGERLLEEFVLDAELQGLSDGTITTYRSQLAYFLRWLDGDVRVVGRDELKRFLSHLKHDRTAMDGSTGLSASTLNSYFSALNSFYAFLRYEDIAEENPVPNFRTRYLDTVQHSTTPERQLISVEEMSMLVQATLDVRDRAVITLLAKTGIRRNELVNIDRSDIDWEEQSIRLKPTKKRSNNLVFFDGECRQVLERWLSTSERNDLETDALFTNQYGGRLKRSGVYKAVTKHAETVGLHDPDSTDPQERFTPHCCRHWFTTYLRRSGMPREFIKELRGDTRAETVDIYDHIDRQELREAYLAHIPTLGI